MHAIDIDKNARVLQTLNRDGFRDEVSHYRRSLRLKSMNIGTLKGKTGMAHLGCAKNFLQLWDDHRKKLFWRSG